MKKRSSKTTSRKPLYAAVAVEKNDLGIFHGELSVAERHAAGKALRTKVPREAHGTWSRSSDHPGAVEIVLASNKGRLPKLVPLRMARMCASPFSFYRGAAAVMAADLAKTPITGIHVAIDGDAHLNNFGLYGSPQRDVLFDLNDFDETVVGPWEWDLKRLTASVNLAARENGFNRRERDAAVRRSVAGYTSSMNKLEGMGVLDTWYLHTNPSERDSLIKADAKVDAILAKAVDKAARQTNLSLLQKTAEKLPDGIWRLREDPPILTRVDQKTRQQVIEALRGYSSTLPRERQFMLKKYRVVDVALRVVGVGSVGTRAYLVLLFGSGENDPLFLQVKEAIPPAHGPYLPGNLTEFAHQGKRVVIGQHLLQSSSDVMLGWTNIGSIPFYVRQMKNMKGSIPVEWLSGSSFGYYGWACGALLARGHARVGDAAAIAGYCGNSTTFANALALWAEAYANQTVLDHAALVNACKKDSKVQEMMGK